VQWMGAGCAVLDPPHMQDGAIEVDLVPAQVAGLGGAQPVSEGRQDHGCVPVTVPAESKLRTVYKRESSGESNCRAGRPAGLSKGHSSADHVRTRRKETSKRWRGGRVLCRFYGASGEDIISIGADVHRMTEPLHATAA
jgi:hypothetical protein